MTLNRRDVLIKGCSAVAGLVVDRSVAEPSVVRTGRDEAPPADVLVQIDAAAGPICRAAADAFTKRLRRSTPLKVETYIEPDGDVTTTIRPKLLLVKTGSAASRNMRSAVQDFGGAVPTKSESFMLGLRRQGDHPPGQTAGAWQSVVCGADARGIVYGLGELLRRLSPADHELRLAPFTLSDAPVVTQRGVYFATHFNNFYEMAPADEIEDYVEEMALWGFNHIWTWFDMNWYPENFDSDPSSRGMQLIQRIRRINYRATSLGMTTGLVGCANEGFSHQPPKALRADPTDRRGQFYPYSSINPSAPRGLDMILGDRRKVLSLIGPINLFVAWPYDPGGCNCKLCHPWPKKFIEIAPILAREVHAASPDALMLLSTWEYRDDELPLMQSLADSQPAWLGGFISPTSQLGKLRPAADQMSLVFPEISMSGSLFTGYGASGANPMPRRFGAEASRTAAAGYGAVAYSEGMYEDINKIVWGRTLWSPNRSPQSVVDEYARYYFGSAHAAEWSKVIMELETTWPPDGLNHKDPAIVVQLRHETERLLRELPETSEGVIRARYLRDRADMDARMVEIGSDQTLARELMALLDEGCYTRDFTAFRLHIKRFRESAADRVRAIDHLYHAYWQYLNLAHLTRSPVLFITLPSFIGTRDWEEMLVVVDQALSEPNNDKARLLLLSGIKHWAWNGNISLDMVSM